MLWQRLAFPARVGTCEVGCVYPPSVPSSKLDLMFCIKFKNSGRVVQSIHSRIELFFILLSAWCLGLQHSMFSVLSPTSLLQTKQNQDIFLLKCKSIVSATCLIVFLIE